MIEETLITSGISKIAGCDEAGRGPCAGPLVVAAVILKFPLEQSLMEIADSKTLKPEKREELFELIKLKSLAYAIIEISVEDIDKKGLHKCNIEGMRRAITALEIEPDYALTDGYEIQGLEIPTLAIWKGDQVSPSVGAASILAKVYRDRVMVELDKAYPEYGFSDHKGYITSKHTAALNEFGPTDIHRKSFANIAALINN
jgi:ribonuclease HII